MERKSKEDLYQSLSWERDRFSRECARLSEFKYPYLIIEASLKDILNPPDLEIF